MATKRCTACKKDKPLSEFYSDRRRKGLRARCVICTNGDNGSRRNANLEKYRHIEAQSKTRDRVGAGKARVWQRNFKLLKKFGLTMVQVEEMISSQGNGCAICGRDVVISAPGRGRQDLACVDHDHKTGDVRGILCNRCNTAIGLLGDSPLLLIRALRYLKGALHV